MNERADLNKEKSLTEFADMLKTALMVLYAVSAMTAMMELAVFMYREGMGVASPFMVWALWWSGVAVVGIQAVGLSRKMVNDTPEHAPFKSILRRVWLQSLIWLVALFTVRASLSASPSSAYVVLYTLQIAIHVTTLILAMTEWDRYQKINTRFANNLTTGSLN